MMYCYKHRGYQKKELRFGICIDCGREFSVAATNNKKIRCNECQSVVDRENARLRKQKQRTLL